MKKAFFFCTLILCSCSLFAQSYDAEKVAWTNYIVRMYKAAPFEGVRVVDNSDSQYLISIVVMDKTKYSNESALNRVASVKAMSQAGRYFNGSRITSDLIIRTNEKSDGTADSEIIEIINENSIGYVKQMEQLDNFSDGDKKRVFIFGTLISNEL